MAKDIKGCGIVINICITCRNVITAYLISQQHDNCWSQAKPVLGVPDNSLQSASKWRQTRLLSRWGQTLLPTRDFIGLLLKGCWWRPWHMIRVGLEQKRSQPNSNSTPPHYMNWVLEGNCDCHAEAKLGIGPQDVRTERIYLHTCFSDGCACRWYDVIETIFTHFRPYFLLTYMPVRDECSIPVNSTPLYH
jgi:hypothetical protein